MIRGMVLRLESGRTGAACDGVDRFQVSGTSSSHVSIRIQHDGTLLASGPIPRSSVPLSVPRPHGLLHAPHVLIRLLSDGRVSFSSGAAMLFPFYVWTRRSGEVAFSWLLEDAITPGVSRVDAATAAEYLSFSQQYTYRTTLEGVFQLTERAQIVAGDGDVTVFPPDDYLAPLPSEVLSDHEATLALIDLLNFAVVDLAPSPAPEVVELSGGRDSSLLALLPMLKRRQSYGILFPGEAGARQQRRRQRIVELNELQDYAVDGLNALRRGVRLVDGTIDPRADMYGPLTVEGLAALGDRRASSVVTGIGGDEAFNATATKDEVGVDNNASDRLWDLPKSWLPETGLMAACSRFAFFQAMDCWPVYPYLHPEVVDFSQRLPVRLLQGRQLQMAALETLGMPPQTMRRVIPENFVELLGHEYEQVVFQRRRAQKTADYQLVASAMRRHALQRYVARFDLVYN